MWAPGYPGCTSECRLRQASSGIYRPWHSRTWASNGAGTLGTGQINSWMQNGDTRITDEWWLDMGGGGNVDSTIQAARECGVLVPVGVVPPWQKDCSCSRHTIAVSRINDLRGRNRDRAFTGRTPPEIIGVLRRGSLEYPFHLGILAYVRECQGRQIPDEA